MDKIFDYIKELQKLPSADKERIAFLSASLIAAIILIFWTISFFRGISVSGDDEYVLGQAKNPTVEDVSPFNSIGSTISSFWSDVTTLGKKLPSKEDIQKISDQISTTTSLSEDFSSTTLDNTVSTSSNTD